MRPTRGCAAGACVSELLSLPSRSRSSRSRNDGRFARSIGGFRSVRPADFPCRRRTRSSAGRSRRARSATGANMNHAAFAAGRREILFLEHDRNMSLCTGTNAVAAKPAQFAIGADGRRRRIGHEQHDRLDQTPPRFRNEADFLHHLEELVERGVAEVDDLGAGVVRDQPVEQRHLALRFGNVDDRDEMRKAAGERRLARMEVVAGKRPAVGSGKIRSAAARSGSCRRAGAASRRCRWGWGRPSASQLRSPHERSDMRERRPGFRCAHPGYNYFRATYNYDRPPACARVGVLLATMSLSLTRSYSAQTLPSQCRT